MNPVLRFKLTRRRFLLVTSSSLAAACSSDIRVQDGAAGAFIDLNRFMTVSRVLTGVDDLRDERSGRQYLAALLADPQRAEDLTRLWLVGKFNGSDPPASVADLVARGVYDVPEFAELADTITGNWYSGTYTTTEGEQRVATYTNALAWRALGYRAAGPSVCGGVFGHWADKPSGA